MTLPNIDVFLFCTKRAAGRRFAARSAGTIFIAVACSAAQWTAFAQAADAPKFEVTTIKPSEPDTEGPVIGISAGSLKLQAFTLRQIMMYAYWIHPDQIQKASGWMESEKFDIVAKPEKSPMPEEQMRRMLQILLSERFKVNFHHEQKDLPVYALTVTKGGSKMKARMPGDGGAGPRLVFQGKSLPGRNVSIAQLIFVLQTRALDKPVIDETGLSGNFDFNLAWSSDPVRGEVGPSDSDNPDLFTAIQQQLGLKLDSRRSPVDVLVIDHAEKPDAN
jgi:uncharacterized protein (TIGR03435 family)